MSNKINFCDMSILVNEWVFACRAPYMAKHCIYGSGGDEDWCVYYQGKDVCSSEAAREDAARTAIRLSRQYLGEGDK